MKKSYPPERESATLTLGVSNLERSAAFYREILQLETERIVPAPDHPPALLVRRASFTLVLREIPALEALHPALFQNLSRHPLGVGMSLEFAVPDLKKILKRAAHQGVHPLFELEDREYGRREAWLHDPDGYLIILTLEPQQQTH